MGPKRNQQSSFDKLKASQQSLFKELSWFFNNYHDSKAENEQTFQELTLVKSKVETISQKFEDIHATLAADSEEDSDKYLEYLQIHLAFLTKLNTTLKDYSHLQEQMSCKQAVTSQAQIILPNYSKTTAGPNIIFENFDEAQETFKSYKERLENFLQLRNIQDEETRTRVLINSIGAKHYMLLSSLTAPNLPPNKTYTELIALLSQHLYPTANIYTEQHRFLCRAQNQLESISGYIAALRNLTSTCQFTCCNADCGKSVAELFLRAQFIRGLIDGEIREKLLQENNLTFEKACSIALTLEASKQGNKEITSVLSTINGNINKIEHDEQRWTPRKMQRLQPFKQKSQLKFKALGIENLCIRCGLANHKTSDCRREWATLECTFCGRQGHVSKVCLTTLTKTKAREIKLVDEENSEDDECQHTVSKIIEVNHTSEIEDSAKFIVPVKIGNKICEFEVDSGSPVSIVSEKEFLKLGLGLSLEPTNIKFRTYTKEIFTPLGVVSVPVEYEGKLTKENLYVVQPDSPAILGCAWLRHLNISINQISTGTPQVDNITKDLVSEYSDVFQPKIGTVPNYKCSLLSKPSMKPIFLKPRPVSYALKDKIEQEIRKYEEEGVFTKTNYSDRNYKPVPKKVPLHVWDEPASNWQRVHMDYAGPFQGHHFLILVDAKSKWPEILMTTTAPTTNSTIMMLREVFSRNGLPDILVSDNTTLFTSMDFKQFCSRNGIRQRFIAPGHPPTNGQAERCVQILKQKLKAMTGDKGTIHQKLHTILFQLRSTPLSSGGTPAEYFMGRNLRTKFDLYRPPAADVEFPPSNRSSCPCPVRQSSRVVRPVTRLNP